MQPRRPLIVGLTGSIGMGKTETARQFASLGIPVHDADAAVHRLYEPGGRAVAAIAQEFPDCVTHGRVDRACLSSRLRKDPSAISRLLSVEAPSATIVSAGRCVWSARLSKQSSRTRSP